MLIQKMDIQICGSLHLTKKNIWHLPSGKLSHNYGKSPFFMGKSTISMAIFNSFLMFFVCLPEGTAFFLA